MKRPLRLLIAALCVLAAASSCTTDDPTVNTAVPLIPTAPTVDTLSGTVPINGRDTQVFSVVLTNGLLNITLTATSQPVIVVLGAGTWDGTTCTLGSGATRNTTAGSTPQIQFTGVPAGNYCTQVIDPGTPPFTAPLAYTIQVAHY